MDTHAGLQAVIVADDLTGAIDAAAPFARRGLDVRVLTSPAALEAVLPELPQVLAINAGTRHAEAETAAVVVSDLVGALIGLQPQLLIKKIDSTLRGHVVVETLSAMQAAGRNDVLVCPAVPSQGRTLSGGELFIEGVPLRETSIGNDLRSPPPVEPLSDQFRVALPGLSVNIVAAGTFTAADTLAGRSQIRIADASNREHLLGIAGVAANDRNTTLFVGAAGLTEALAETLYGPVVCPFVPSILPGETLYVVGSRAPQAEAQIEALTTANPLTRVAALTDTKPLEIQALLSLITQGQEPANLVLRAPLASTATDYDSDLVAKALAASSASLLARSNIRLLLVTGGDTVFAVLDALEVGVIRVCSEVQPGIVLGLIDTTMGPLHLVTKAGGFGDRQLFCTIENYFQ